MLTDNRGYNEVVNFLLQDFQLHNKSKKFTMFPAASPHGMLRFSVIKISCFPRDQSLSAYYLPLHCYMGIFYIINIRSLALCFSIVEALLHNTSPRQYCEVTIWNCSCSPKMCCRRLPSSSYNLVKKQLDSRQRLRD